MGIAGARLLLGDGLITPVISVISAIEGLNVIFPDFSHFIMPIAFVILWVLFLCQRFGTAKISFFSGPFYFTGLLLLPFLEGLLSFITQPSPLETISSHYSLLARNKNGYTTMAYKTY